MSQTPSISPLTRVEGHLDIQLTLDKPDSMFTVTKAQSSGTMFRGFENILMGRDPRDATHYTQRICGVCPISHAMAATMTLEQAFGIIPPDNGRILRNLILGANFLQSHVLHFYHLAAPDYIDTTGILDMSPWKPRFVTPDMVAGDTAKTLVGHYVQALAIRRKAHQMGAIFGGKLPHAMSMVPGGCTSEVTAQKIADFKALLTEIQTFINNVYLPDVLAVAKAFPQYGSIGKGCGNLIAYGVFDLNAGTRTGGGDNGGGTVNTTNVSRLLARGRYTGGNYSAVDPAQITEYVKHSYYTPACDNLNPSRGLTVPSVDKAGAYSWLKAPRYQGKVHEAGPLARMWINGDYRNGVSVIDRVAARAYEAKKIAVAMAGWLTQLRAGAADYTYKAEPTTATGIGLTEAPRALGHWMQVASKKISRYQVITPTAWNASPQDDNNVGGPIEQALTGLRIADIAQPVEALRVVHSFDPCLSCSVHFTEPKRNGKKFVVHL